MNVTTVKGRTLNGEVETLPFINPATSEQFGEVVTATAEDVISARREMAAAAKVWAAKPLKERIRILRQLQKLIIDEIDEITAVMNQDNGKSRQDALIEILMTVDLMNSYCKKAPKWLSRQRVSSGLQVLKRCYVDHQPHGVVGVIGPWNYPFVLLLPPIFSALLAGNTVLAKPSEVTGATGVMIEKLFQQIPELSPYVRFLHGDGRVGQAMVESKPDLVYLTGSVLTGKKVMQTAAPNLTRVVCELGSKDPMIVLEDADIGAAAKWGVWGAFFNTGQNCVSVERVYVVASVYEQFVEAVLEETKKLKVGYSSEIDNQFDTGPFTFQRQVNIVEDHMQDALAKGAKVALGGQREGMFMEPTVVLNVDHSMALMHDETFGPIMPIMKVDDEVHAVQLANHSHMGLGASVWSKNIKRAERVAQQLETGSVNINDTMTHFAVPTLPFGGVKESGSGRAHGRKDLMQFTASRSVMVSSGPHPLDIAIILRKPGTYKLNKAILKLAFGVTPKQRLEPVQELLGIPQNGQAKKSEKLAIIAGGAAAVAAAAIMITKFKK
ncbi:MAG: aldehyde dehydrogenase family protein [Chloroflexi bacterium]|nr:aldehyde dehydrogenase family protein [Chloroflexota bacterium]